MFDVERLKKLPSPDANRRVVYKIMQNAMIDAADEIERLRGVLADLEFLTATGNGLDPEQTITVHLLAAEGRAHEPQAWRFDPRVVAHVHKLVRGNIELMKKEEA